MKEKSSTHIKNPLTPREVEVLRLIAAGRSNQAIADELVLSYNTVKWYVRQIFNKLGVDQRTQAVAAARSLGILKEVHNGKSGQFVHTLTDREVEILVLMDAGLSNTTIAERLGISYHTVTWYVQQIYKKLEVNRRTQAVAVARVLGFLDNVPGSESQSRYGHYLPAQSTPFIGRKNELAEIQAKLNDENCRLLTLLGPGGSGKTRLAIEAARARLTDCRDGVYFVNLAPVQEADKIASTVAGVLGLSFYENRPPQDQLFGFLRNKELLLLLDNFEHLLAGANIIIQIIHTAPSVKVLVTSRASLNVTGEHIFPVMGMAYPEAPASLETVSQEYSAVKLFEAAAKRKQPTFELTGQNTPDVIRTCALVAGMPLGVILAASWVRILSPAEIADELARDLAFQETELRDLPPRQRSMRSAFNYSWRLLSEKEQKIMAALSVFRGGFNRDGAKKITGTSLNDLKSLIDQSMLHVVPNGRYEVHELLRQFAAEKLAMDPAVDFEIRRKHSEIYFQNLMEWELALQGPQQVIARKEMVREIDNIRAAWAWTVGKLRLKRLLNGINGLCFFYDRNRQRLEGEAICQSLVDWLEAFHASDKFEPGAQNEDRTSGIVGQKLKARALAWGGYFNMRLGNVERSHKLLQKCLSTLKISDLVDQDTRFEKGIAYLTLPSVIKNIPGAETIQLAEKAVELFKSLDEPWWMGFALYSLGTQKTFTNEEKWYFDESLAVQRALGDMRGMIDSLESGSYNFAANFQFEKAEMMLSEALAISIELEDRHKMVSVYGTLGWQWVWQGRFEEARALYRQTLETYSDLEYSQSYAFIIHAHLGYPNLYLGEYQMARSQALHVIELSRELKSYMADYWTAMCTDILGKAALAEGSFEEAEGYFQECLLLFQTYVYQEKISTTLACLGYIARAKNQISRTQKYFCAALRIAVDGNFYP